MAFEPNEPQEKIKYDEMRIYSDEELNNYTEEELKNFKTKHDTPMCDDLESGPWPSFVADAKREALHRRKLADDRILLSAETVEDTLGQLEDSFVDGKPTGNTVASSAFLVMAEGLSAGIPIYKKNIPL